jgi:hypothetical protein
MKKASLLLGLFVGTFACGQTLGNKWMDSFDDFKDSIRTSDPAHRSACERQLRGILTTIDDNRACSTDAQCTLINQDPFGSTVPVRTEREKSLRTERS